MTANQFHTFGAGERARFNRSPPPSGSINGPLGVVDVLVMLFAGVSALPNLFHDHRHPSAAEVLALARVVVPLSVRRIWPVPDFAWVILAAGAVGCGTTMSFPASPADRAVHDRRASPAAWRWPARGEAATIAALVKLDGRELGGPTGSSFPAWSQRRADSACTRLPDGPICSSCCDRAERLERECDQQGALAAAAERARIAWEMHDIVAHHLTVMVALSDGAIAASARSPERAGEAMRAVSATGRRALTDTRRLLGVPRGSMTRVSPVSR